MYTEGMRVFVLINGEKQKGTIISVIKNSSLYNKYQIQLLDGSQVIVHESNISYEVGI